MDNGEVFSFHSCMKAITLSYDDSAKELRVCFAERIGQELQVGFYEKDDLDKFIENLDDWGCFTKKLITKKKKA